MLELAEKIGAVLWTPVMLVVLMGSSVILTIKFKFFQVTQIKKITKETVGSLFPKKPLRHFVTPPLKGEAKKARKKNKTEITPFEAVSAALAGTMGVGNIAGVATAITAGGPGAIFWMWISAFFCMIIKYIEVILSQLYKQKKNGGFIGGPMYYISAGLKSRGLAVLFSFFCIVSSFGIGNMSQANTIANSFESTFNIPGIITGTAVAIITMAIIIGGVKRIVSFTSKFIPLMSVIYMIGAIIIIIFNSRNLPESIKTIFADAFAIKQAGAGILGFVMSRAVRFGISRGIFSNEAGLGSAPIAHAISSPESPVQQGMWGIFEVFFDTIVVCTLTAFAILTSNAHKISGLDGINLTNAAFASVFGSISGIFLSVSIIFFAIATLISWSFYGECCIAYLFENSRENIINLCKNIYKLVFTGLIIVGSVINIKTVWSLSDIFNALMALPNITAVIILSPKVYRETKKYLS
ncbi:MAG: sodium:alanine symporter family protein [Oscillospiraceae bacterium]|nr:sodium:alanine symporter family protein [Oscillospiraceae bacterium]